MLIYDIETAANEQADAYYAKKEYTPDSSLSTIDEPPAKVTEIKSDELRMARLAEWRENQAAKITKSIEAKKAADQAKAALSWWTGKVICICGVTDKGIQVTFNAPNEKELLLHFGKFVSEGKHRLIGKSSEDFDRPFLIGRYLHHDIGVPDSVANETPRQISDINQIISLRTSCSQLTSLANMAWGLCLEQKGGHGSEVEAWYRAGEMDKIVEYCKQDVKLTAEIFARWEKPFEF